MTAKIRIQEPRTGGAGLPPIEPHGFGGGGDSPGRGNNRPDDRERLKRYRFGLALGLMAITMLFVGAAATFLLRQHFGRWSLESSTYVRDWVPLPLPFPLLMLNTLVLAASSLTAELARRRSIEHAVLEPALAIPGVAKERPNNVWLLATVALGAAFIGGQVRAWHSLTYRGFNLSSGPSSSFFYLLTGTHAAHLAVGILILLYAAAASLVRRSPSAQRIVVDIAAWYWHVMGVLWVGIFTLLWVVRS